MAIVLEANYSKKLGLPGYSSHQYSVTLRTEITDPAQVAAESNRLYDLLQGCVDSSIQKVGFLPDTRNGNSLGVSHGRHGNGNGNTNHQGHWACSPKQKNLILRIVEEQGLEKSHVEALAEERFGKSVKTLSKLEASGLIDELLMQTGTTPGPNDWQLNRGSNPTANR